MESTILKENLKNGLSVVERIAVRSSSLPILNSILFSTKQNALELSTTDLELGIRYTILSKNKTEGQSVIPSKFLSNFISFLPDTQITLQTKDGALHVISKNHNTIIKTINTEEFPLIPGIKDEKEFIEVDTPLFCSGLAQVEGFSSQSQTRPEITGTLFSFSKKTMKVVATDSFRLAEKIISLTKELLKERSFILPQKSTRELVSILGDKKGKTKIYISPNQVIFDYSPGDPSEPKIQLISRVIEGEYPPYQDVIPSDHTTKITLERNSFLNQVKAASIFSGKTDEVKLIIDPVKKGTDILSKSADLGENTSFLEGKVEGERVEVAFNWRFLSDGIAQMKSSRVELYLNGQEGPALLKTTDDSGYQYVVMPIKA